MQALSGNNSRYTLRSPMWRAGIAVLLLLSTFLRPTVHSHASVAQAGVDAGALAFHIQLFHSKPGDEIPADAPHVHWQWNTVVSTVPSANSERVAPAQDEGRDWLLESGFQLACLSFDQPVELGIEDPATLLPSIPMQIGPCNRIRFCVWTC